MLEIRLLGELEVLRDGTAVPLPASKKSRALLGYLAATQRPHTRQRLCELLWDGPDDPRAALRWSLTKLRAVVGDRLAGGGDRVELRSEGAAIDALRLCPPRNATTDRLEETAALFRGEFLEGLDLPGCFRYQQWCAGERERLRQAHVAVLAELTQRLSMDERAVEHARRRVAVDPFSDQAHATLIRLLAMSGRSAEAIRQYEQCRQVFERELGSRPGPSVEDARRAIGRTAAASQPAAAAIVAPESAIFVGREAELEQVASASGVVLISGEPGIGKTRLLAELARRTDGTTLYGRAFAAEMIRPYGIWIEALRDFPAEADRGRLFEAVLQSLRDVALIAFDDLQWIDEASAALLHYMARSAGGPRIVCSARTGELDDNPHAARLIRELQREHRLTRIQIGSLSLPDTCALVASAPDPEQVARRSGGNPLFAIELARSGSATGALTSVITDRLAALDGPARELVSWAAAIGHDFDVEVIGRATAMPSGEMLTALEKLERAAIIRPAGGRGYDFVHDLVRDAAYQMISGPRRALVHRQIARALSECHDASGALAGDIVHHASLAGEHELAATAAIDAGKRCMRLFAYAEAVTVARRGLQIVEALSGDRGVELEMRLLHILVFARVPVSERIGYAGRIAELTDLARRAGLAGTAALGAHLLALLHEETNNYAVAAQSTIRSAEMSRGADPATAAISMATSARCLLMLQRDISKAEALIAQAQAIGVESRELALGIGYLLAHRGRSEEAIPHLERGFELAAEKQDHWREWVALWRLVTLALEEGDPARALEHCARLRPVAGKMKGGSEAVRSEILESVTRYAMGERVDIEATIDKLRSIDSKSDIAWTLDYLAELAITRGDQATARRYAAQALQAAEAVGRDSEAIIARCILGLPARPSADMTARARRFLKERKHGHSRRGAHFRSAGDQRRTQ